MVIKMSHDVKDGDQIFLIKGKTYPVKAEEPSNNLGKVILVVESEIEDEEILIETDIEESSSEVVVTMRGSGTCFI